MEHANRNQAEFISAIMRPADAAKYLSVSVQTLYRWAAEGKLPRPLKLGERASGWKKADLDAYIASLDGTAEGGAA